VAVRLSVLLAVLGAVVIAAGAAMVFPPAGVFVSGVECVVASYVIRYLEARREAP
jgi:hypothetical protein